MYVCREGSSCCVNIGNRTCTNHLKCCITYTYTDIRLLKHRTAT